MRIRIIQVLPRLLKQTASVRGFTLAELLIALAILGVIATFTIPKVLQSQQDEKFNAIAKENIAAISAAYSLYRLNNGVQGTMKTTDLTPYLNYVQYDTSGIKIDNNYLSSPADKNCNAITPCTRMHNGSLIRFHANLSFGGTGPERTVYFLIDQDGKYTSTTTNSSNKSLLFFLYIDGAIKSSDSLKSGTLTYDGTSDVPYTANTTPPWFSWD